MNTKQKPHSLIAVLLLFVIIAGCGGTEETWNIPMEKKFWTVEDYDQVLNELRFKTPEGSKLPNYADPKTSIIVKKAVDPTHYEVVLTDKELGIEHRNRVSSQLFPLLQNFSKLYGVKDRQDKYLYPEEMVDFEAMNLGYQILYFDLGNEEILHKADDPNSTRVKNLIASNIRKLVGNFNFYLDLVNSEDGLTTAAVEKLATGIDEHFATLLKTHPETGYGKMKKKADLMLAKAQNAKLKVALEGLILDIDALAAEKEK